MNFFDHKNLGNHLLQLCPKVVKHPVYILVTWHTHYLQLKYATLLQYILGKSNYEIWLLNSEPTLKNYRIKKIISCVRVSLQRISHRKLHSASYEPCSPRRNPQSLFCNVLKRLCLLLQTPRLINWRFHGGFLWLHKKNWYTFLIIKLHSTWPYFIWKTGKFMITFLFNSWRFINYYVHVSRLQFLIK